MIRLVLVELRRATDTRAPRWAFGCGAVIAGLVGLVSPARDTASFAEFVAAVSLLLPLLMGLLAVMAFTADWSTRAALTTFTTTPRRHVVLGARYVAILALGIATLVAVHLLAAAAFVVRRPGAAASVFEPEVATGFGQMAATTIAASLTAMAVASLVLRTALALVVAVLGPLAITIGLAFVPGVLEWINPYGFANWLAAPTMTWVTDADSTSVGLGQAMASFLLWTAIPLALGWQRQLRAEPR